MDFRFGLEFLLFKNRRTGKWSEISTVRIQDTVLFPTCLHLTYILSINVAEACVILVGLVIVGIKPAEKYVSSRCFE